MTLAYLISPWLLQASALPDTIVTMPVRSWYDYTNGTLQLIVLILAIVFFAALVALLMKLNAAINSAKGMFAKLHDDVKPIIAQATQISGDAREVVAMLRTDAERVNHAVGAVSEQLLDVAAAMENRIDEVTAVIDVVQDELEETALTATAAMRGARLGGRALAGGLSKAIMGAVSKPSDRSRREGRGSERDRPPMRSRDRELSRPSVRDRELNRRHTRNENHELDGTSTRDRDAESDRPQRRRNRDSDGERRFRENG